MPVNAVAAATYTTLRDTIPACGLNEQITRYQSAVICHKNLDSRLCRTGVTVPMAVLWMLNGMYRDGRRAKLHFDFSFVNPFEEGSRTIAASVRRDLALSGIEN